MSSIRSLLSCFAIGLVCGAAAVAAYTANATNKEIDSLKTTIESRNNTIVNMNHDAAALRRTIDANNERVKKMNEDTKTAIASSALAIEEMKAVAKKRQIRILELEKIKTPVVNLSVMTSGEIERELGDCRRAVEINNHLGEAPAFL